MPDPGEGQGGAAQPKKLPPGVERFVKAFEKATISQEGLADAFDGLFEMIGHKENGLISAIDELRDSNIQLAEQIVGLRKDIRTAAQARGLVRLFDLM